MCWLCELASSLLNKIVALLNAFANFCNTLKVSGFSAIDRLHIMLFNVLVSLYYLSCIIPAALEIDYHQLEVEVKVKFELIAVSYQIYPASWGVKATLGNLQISDDNVIDYHGKGIPYRYICDMRDPEGSSFIEVRTFNPILKFMLVLVVY